MAPKWLVGLLLALCPLLTSAQAPTLSPYANISVLTCGPGEALYSTFGHSAIRVSDPVQQFDKVYNYGTFNFNTPNFYLKFAKGQLRYSLSRQEFPYFLHEYEQSDRWVKEQVLNLSSEEKQKLFTFLERNALPQNRDYKYDFLYDNCATKVPDVLKKVYGAGLDWDFGHLEHVYTFRELIHQYLEHNTWSAFGIDLALGSVIDVPATPAEHLFLPDYVLEQLRHTQLNGQPLVETERDLYLQKQPTPTSSPIGSPAMVLGLFLLFIVIITYSNFKQNTKSLWLDVSLFLITGIAGVLLSLMWFWSDHTATAGNFNILWAFPFNLLAGLALLRKSPPQWFGLYLKFLLLLLVVLLILWAIQFQIFSPLLPLLLLALALRYVFLSRRGSTKAPTSL